MRFSRDTAPDGTLLIAMSGAIDENADLDGVLSTITANATINMREIVRVNSMGVHAWIPAITKCAASHKIVIEEISYALVQNANVVANLFGTAHVRSCMAPYYCARCKDNPTLLVTEDDIVHSSGEPPKKVCSRCSMTLEFDELDGYFAFFRLRRGL